MPKKITPNDLAKMMKKGFDETTRNFAVAVELLKSNTKKVDSVAGALHLTRQEMAKDENLKKVETTVNSIYTMLDDEARFIQQMRAEYPLILKRLERIEKQLGLPHTLSRS